MTLERITAIDIGTRSVVGLVMEKQQDSYKIIASAVEEHKERAMYDGQIHDIPLVIEVVQKIRQALEEKIGSKVEEIAVAAAGRSLKTARGHALLQKELGQVYIDDILALEMQAVQRAQQNLQSDSVLDTEYHCVGYSIINYFLDGNCLRKLVGQRGEKLEVEIIATFLPRVVIDSLFAVLNGAGLKMASLTLEPIAAAEVAVPSSMRQLNLALIDIGAGTSDIAITSEGTISAYAMVPVAGDEVTEAIAQHFLLDFQTAEKVKRSMHKTTIQFKDVVGNTHSIPTEQIKQLIAETVEGIAKQIAEAIMLLNYKPPQAVICIGGGSLTPGITEYLAKHMDLPLGRIGVKGKDSLTGINGSIKNISVPQMLTPVGIAITALNNSGLNFIEIEVNESSVRLLAVKNLSVTDALIAAGITLKQLYGKPGKALTVEINGQLTFLRGGKGKSAQILLNNLPCKLEDGIKQGDKIHFIPAEDGKDYDALLRDIIDLKPLCLYVNNQEVNIEPLIRVNGKNVDNNYRLEDNCIIEYQPLLRLDYILEFLGYSLNDLPYVKLNGQTVEPEAIIKKGDRIELHSSTQGKPAETNFHVNFNGKNIVFFWNKNIAPILSDLFAIMDFELPPESEKKSLVMKINGKEAGFTTSLQRDDDIQMYWQ